MTYAGPRSPESSCPVPDRLPSLKVMKMLYERKSMTIKAGLAVLTVLLSACGGDGSGGSGGGDDTSASGPNVIDVSEASIVSEASKLNTGTVIKTGNDFSFPEVNTVNGAYSITIPAGPLPLFPARRAIAEGDGAVVGFGDPVILKYDMFAWSTGELVESSSQFEEAHTVQGGVSDRFPIPEYLAKSLLGRSIGDTIQVVLPVGTEDLPGYLDPNDAYVLLVELL